MLEEYAGQSPANIQLTSAFHTLSPLLATLLEGKYLLMVLVKHNKIGQHEGYLVE